MPTSVACIGCGMTIDPQGRLTLDTAGWPYACDPGESNYAQPIGCGSDGLVWAPPRQVVVNTLYSRSSTPGLYYGAPPNTSAQSWTHTFTLQIHNPDPCRRLTGLALIEIDIRADIAPGGEVSFAAVGNNAWMVRNDSSGTHTYYNEFTRNLTVSVPPGGNQTLTWTVGTGLLFGTARVRSADNTVRILAVSSQPT